MKFIKNLVITILVMSGGLFFAISAGLTGEIQNVTELVKYLPSELRVYIYMMFFGMASAIAYIFTD